MVAIVLQTTRSITPSSKYNSSSQMERRKYVDVHSLAYNVDGDKLIVQILKVLLEMITATTFVMLDRLFFEALDVVRQHAEMDATEDAHHDMQVEVRVWTNVRMGDSN